VFAVRLETTPAPWVKDDPNQQAPDLPSWIKRRSETPRKPGEHPPQPGPETAAEAALIAQQQAAGPPQQKPPGPSLSPQEYEAKIAQLQKQLDTTQQQLAAERAVLEQSQQALTAQQEQLTELVQSVENIRRRVLEASESDLVRLSLVVAEKVVGRELQTDSTIVSGWVREGIDALVYDDQLDVVVSADVAETLKKEQWTDAEGKPIELAVDPSLPPASCDLRGEFSHVKVSVQARLAVIADALGVPEGVPAEDEAT